jgi:hypothetical protein
MKHQYCAVLGASLVLLGCVTTPSVESKPGMSSSSETSAKSKRELPEHVLVAPAAEKFDPTEQHKMLAAGHWGKIAADLAEQTKTLVSGSESLQGRPLFVAPNSSAPFDLAFANYMITSLVKAGLPVSTKRNEALEVKYETQVIYHQVSFDPKSRGFFPWDDGFWVSHDVDEDYSDETVDPEKAKMRTAPTNTELVITTSIADNDQYLLRSTDAYYIEKAEAGLFKSSAFKTWGVVGK